MGSSGEGDGARQLERLRRKIDGLDNQLLELIERRLETSNAIAAFKEGEGERWLRLRPRREEQIVARLTARARLAPPRLIGHVWRDLLSHSLQAQAPTLFVLHALGDRHRLLERMREHYGWTAPVRWVETPEEVVKILRHKEAVGMIEIGPSSNWWNQLEDCDEVRIFDGIRGADGKFAAVLLGRVAEDDLSEEQSFRILDAQSMSSIAERGEAVEQIAAFEDLRLCVVRRGTQK